MIKVSQLLKTVSTADGDLNILRGIDLEIDPGGSAAIVGASGSGSLPCWGSSRGWMCRLAGNMAGRRAPHRT